MGWGRGREWGRGEGGFCDGGSDLTLRIFFVFFSLILLLPNPSILFYYCFSSFLLPFFLLYLSLPIFLHFPLLFYFFSFLSSSSSSYSPFFSFPSLTFLILPILLLPPSFLLPFLFPFPSHPLFLSFFLPFLFPFPSHPLFPSFLIPFLLLSPFLFHPSFSLLSFRMKLLLS